MCGSSRVREGQTIDRMERELQHENDHEPSGKSRKETGKERRGSRDLVRLPRFKGTLSQGKTAWV